MLARLARWCVTHKWITIFAIWVPILVGVNIVAGAAGSAFSTDFTFPDSESAEVIDQLEPVSPTDAGFPGQIVFTADQGVDDPEVQAAMEAEMKENPKSLVSWTSDQVRVSSAGDFALENGSFNSDPDGDGKKPAVQGTFATTWAKVDGEWRVLSDAGGANAEAPAP